MTGTGEFLEIRRLAPDLAVPTWTLLAAVAGEPEGRFFTPHPFSQECIASLAAAPGQDLYHVLISGPRALAYGLLRGWNEGYEVPSLGVAVLPQARGKRLGRLMMEFLHAAAAARGARKVRLRVHFSNQKAVSLYRRLGYEFETPNESSGMMVGWKDLVTG